MKSLINSIGSMMVRQGGARNSVPESSLAVAKISQEPKNITPESSLAVAKVAQESQDPALEISGAMAIPQSAENPSGAPKKAGSASYSDVFQRKGYRPAIYGISGAQRELCALTRRLNEIDSATPSRTIAGLNKSLDKIVHFSRNETRYQKPKNVIKTFKKHILRLDRIRAADHEARAWGEFLKLNQGKLDPIIKLNKSLSKVESYEDKMDVVKRFCYKNTSGQSNVEGLAKFLLDMILNQGVKNVHDVNENKIPSRLQLDFSEMFVKHFFRNTSKLGLEFYAENNIHIVFSWGDGKSGLLNLDVIKEKAWKSQEYRFGNTFEPITFSEIRHVLRNPEIFEGKVFKVHVRSVEPPVFGFSDSLNSDMVDHIIDK